MEELKLLGGVEERPKNVGGKCCQTYEILWDMMFIVIQWDLIGQPLAATNNDHDLVEI